MRSLLGEEELEVYVRLHRAAFDSEKMTRAWRKRTLEHPAYKPELDLKVEAKDGTPAGFCIGWFWQVQGQLYEFCRVLRSK